MRIGILVGACGLAVAAATQADVTSTTTAPVTNQVEDRSVDALHRAIGAPGTMMRDEIVRDLKTRVLSGEVSPFKVLLTDALPDWKIANVGGEFGPNRVLGGEITLNGVSRAIPTSSFDDTFSSYPLSTDPIFDRFQVNMQDQVNPSGEPWDFSQTWYIPSLFVAGQVDADDPTLSDPLPRWQGSDLVENVDLGLLAADINVPGGDGLVDTADLGTLIGQFGQTGPPGPPAFTPADLNADGVVDTADLGALISQFGQTSGPFCLYSVDVAQSTDTDLLPLDPGTIAAGPSVTQVIAVLNGAYNNDVDADGCPDCGFFRILTDGAVGGEMVYGDWTLTDPVAADASTADFKADVIDDNCSGYGSEAVLADARGDAGVIQTACCFFGARTTFPLFTPTVDHELIMNVDVYYTTLDTFQWVDTTSSVEGFTVTRTFMGGYAPSLTTQFLKYSTGGDGFINHFIFLGNLPGVFTIGQFYGTAPDPLLPTPGGVANVGIEIKTDEWFTLSYRLKTNEVSIWLKDSETMALNDANPGDDGSGTPQDGSDDLEAGFAKIFPFGPFGIAPGTGDGQSPDIPQGPLAAVSMDTFRFLWSGDPTPAQVPGWEPHNQFYDNIHVEGVLFPVPDLPKFALNYVDDIETYFGGGNLAVMGGRWFDALSSRAIIDDFVSASGQNSILQDNPFGDGNFRLEFQTDLPLATAAATNWIATTNISVSNTTVVRTIRLGDDTVSLNPNTATVARLLTGVQNINGIVIVDGNGSSTIHMRVENPLFNPAVEASPRDVDLFPSLVDSPNPRFINVPTNAKTLDTELNTFVNYSFEVDAVGAMVVRKNGVPILPDGAAAVAAGYDDGMGNLFDAGWFATSNAVDEMSFESGNQQGGAFVALNVDDVTLTGFGPVIEAGPDYVLPYADDFELYPNNSPINGQGDTPFIDGASIVDTNLTIEQGLQALNTTTAAVDNWCRYLILSDTIGGIDPGNAWGLSDGDEIFVRQATAFGPAIACKTLENFTNPNRPDEFFPNVGLFDDPMAMTPLAAAGVRVVNNGLYAGDPLADGLTANALAFFDWDTYDPANVFCKYVVNTIADADPDTAGQQNVATASLPANQPFYDNIGSKILNAGVTIAVDQIFTADPLSGVVSCPGVIDVENMFRVADHCDVEILTGTWTYVGDGMGIDDAQPLAASDVPHFNFVSEGFPRYRGGGINVVDDPSATGFGQVLQAINLAGFEEGGGYFVDLRSTFPTAYAVVGTDCVFEVDCYVTDNRSRYAIQFDGPNGTVTNVQLGGPDNDPELSLTQGSPNGVAIPSTDFAILENNPLAGGFLQVPDTWYYGTGTAVPVVDTGGGWFRLRITVTDGGNYTIDMDTTGVPGGSNMFTTAISTSSEGSTVSGEPMLLGADAIDGFDTNTGLDQGGSGTFLRDPITVVQDTTLPLMGDLIEDYCYYQVDDVEGTLLGVLPAPCDGVYLLNDILGFKVDTMVANWPDSANPDVCPTSQMFNWVVEGGDAMVPADVCVGDWTWVDQDNDTTVADYPTSFADVTSFGTYLTIPPFNNPGQPSSWYFDNVSLNGSDVE